MLSRQGKRIILQKHAAFVKKVIQYFYIKKDYIKTRLKHNQDFTKGNRKSSQKQLSDVTNHTTQYLILCNLSI